VYWHWGDVEQLVPNEAVQAVADNDRLAFAFIDVAGDAIVDLGHGATIHLEVNHFDEQVEVCALLLLGQDGEPLAQLVG
jgi:hypothetical protein